MARPKETGRFSNASVQQFLRESQAQTVGDVQEALRELFGKMLQAVLEGEMEYHLGYAKNDSETIGSSNRRNGQGRKTVRSDYGDVALAVPRDQGGSFEPRIVHKRQKMVTGIEDQILALYAKGISCREIGDRLERL